MIRIESPSMVLNALDCMPHYRMDASIIVTASWTVREIVDQIVAVADSSPGQRLANLVICSHGNSGRIFLGSGITEGNFGPFADIGGRVDTIWILACRVARLAEVQMSRSRAVPESTVPHVTWDGGVFLSRFAQLTQSYVFASSEIQVSSGQAPRGYIDSWEGLVARYNPDGRRGGMYRYPSTSLSRPNPSHE